MTKTRTKHHIDGLLTLLLFGVFAACVLSVLLTGAGVYRHLTQRDQQAYRQRTCAQYLATKLRQADGPQAVSVGSFGGEDALLLAQELEGETYLTRVYCYDGWLRELFAAEGDEFLPEDGEKLLPARSLALALDGGLLRAQLTEEAGQTVSLTLSVRGREGAPA